MSKTSSDLPLTKTWSSSINLGTELPPRRGKRDVVDGGVGQTPDLLDVVDGHRRCPLSRPCAAERSEGPSAPSECPGQYARGSSRAAVYRRRAAAQTTGRS